MEVIEIKYIEKDNKEGKGEIDSCMGRRRKEGKATWENRDQIKQEHLNTKQSARKERNELRGGEGGAKKERI